MRRFIALSTLLLLTACGDTPGCPPIPTLPPVTPADCAALSARTDWGVEVGSSANPLPVGGSHIVDVYPQVDAACASTVASVTWSVDNPSVASVVPRGSGYGGLEAWVTAVAPGVAAVSARIVFSDGKTQDARPGVQQVVPAATPPASGAVIAEGAVSFSETPPNASVHQFIPFSVPAAGTVDVTVDWLSPLDSIDFSVYRGPCTAIGNCGTIVMTSDGGFVKPIRGSNNLSAGDFTIRLDDNGSGPETVHYQVRLTPR